MGLFGKKTKDASVGLYGKHPSASDFLRLNAGSPGLRALDAWISEALTVAQRSSPDWASVYASGSTLSFVFPRDETALLGALSPSTDRSGRQFPLVVFGEVPLDLATREQAGVPGCSLLDEASSLLARRASLGRDELLDAVSRLTPPGPSTFAEGRRRSTSYLESVTCGVAFKAMFGEISVAERAVAALDDACRSGGSFAVACPLGPDPAGDVGLWFRLVHVLGRGRLQPGMLWSEKMLLLFFGRFTPRALLALWTPDGAVASELYDLRSVEVGRGRGLPVDSPLASWLGGLP